MPFLTLANPWLLLVLLVMLGVAYLGGYWNGKDQARDAALRHEALIARASEAAQRAAAAEIAQINVRHTTIKQKVQREIIEKPVYRGCVHDSDGLRLVNQALAGGAYGVDDRQLPERTGGVAR